MTMTYAQHNARRFAPVDSKRAPRRETRDAYQMHEQRYTREQQENAARLAGRLSFA